MKEYCQRRYGDSSLVLHPKVVVLHYTAGGTAESTHDLFAANEPNGGELPGVVAHFVVDKDGTIYQQLPLDIRGRHAIGLNQVAIGIEFVQEGGSGPEWADQQILHRKKQLTGGLALVAWLQEKFGIADRDVIGHASADDHRYFKDLAGMHNDHGDWLGGDVAQFRKALRKLRGE
jgi:N-acetyl-anhydromuramyl-L-alanine amidase AmpD